MNFFVSNQNYIQFLIDYYRIGFQQLKFKTICNLHIKIPSLYMMLLVSCCWCLVFFLLDFMNRINIHNQYVIGAQLTAIKHISRISRRTSCFNIQYVLCTHFFTFYKITCVKYIQITFAFLKSRKKMWFRLSLKYDVRMSKIQIKVNDILMELIWNYTFAFTKWKK